MGARVPVLAGRDAAHGADICDSFLGTARRLVDLGLDYLSLDRAGATSPRADASACSSPAWCATDRQACSMCWTSPQSACILPMSTAWWA
ncbi:MAG: hypothetical protein ACLU0O_06170 [Collinsella sp.]